KNACPPGRESPVRFGTAIAASFPVTYRNMGTHQETRAMTNELSSAPSIPSSPPPDELARVLAETRARFVATFVTDYDAIAALLEEALVHPAGDALTELTGRVHRLVGLPGTIGFPTISRRA